jgi:hypothetical protein
MANAKVDPQLMDWPTLEKNATLWTKKFLQIDCLRQTVIKYGEEHFFNGLDISIKPPISWWTERHDIDFLLGSLKHGLGKQDAIRNDPALPFFTLCQEVEADGTIKCRWPQPLALGARFKTLIQAIRERDGHDDISVKKEKSGGTKRKGDELSPSQDQKRSRKEEKQSAVWTDRETQELIDAMMAFGTIRSESWDAIRTHHPIFTGISSHKRAQMHE